MDKTFLEMVHGKEFANKWFLVLETLSNLKCPHEEHWKYEDGTARRTDSMFILVETPNNSFRVDIAANVCCNEFESILISEARKLV